MRTPLLALLALAASGCPGTRPAAADPRPASDAAPSSSTLVVVDAGGGETPFVGGAVKAPVFSDDPCEADADCAPVATCHPDRCVAKDKRGTLAEGTMCTEVCLGGTLDCGFNRCGCAANGEGKRRCAVVPPTFK